jgi:succinate dehydrogenase/fumarate reductase flavoprotein subunit
MLKLKQVAVSRGVKMMDKIYIPGLLQHDGKVIGAIGFGLVDHKTYIFQAKSTVIACGGTHTQCNRRFTVNWGEGQLIAFHAGAQLMNAELGLLVNAFVFRLGDIYRRGPYYLFFENALGERFMGRYYPELMGGLKMGQEQQDFRKVAESMLREVEAGRGPIYIDFSKLTQEEMEVALRKDKVIPTEYQAAGGRGDLMRYIAKFTGHDPMKEKLEVVTQVAHFGGAVRADVDCKTTLEGLWVAGDASMYGSGESGAKIAQFSPGFGIPWAAVTGFRAGRSAGEHASQKSQTGLPYELVKKETEQILSPMGKSGTVKTQEVVYRIQQILLPVKGALRWEAGLLSKAISELEGIKQEFDQIGAKDHHELSRIHQARSLLFSTETMLKAAYMRQESRGDFHRMDYPNRDDKKWLKWIVIEQSGGSERLFTENVPLGRYRLKPLSQ